MAKVVVKNLIGKKIEEINLNDQVFGLDFNNDLVHQVYVSQYANQRKVLAHTKDRAERAGTGKKPWKQKGTGRARAGSVRSPLWRKGGVTFGPTKERNFSKKVNSKMKELATKMVLSSKLKDQELIVIDDFGFKENRTKEASAVLNNLKIDKKVLWAFSKEDQEKKRASRNIKKVKNISVENLNVFDMLNTKFLLLDKKSLLTLESKYLKGKEIVKEKDIKNNK